MSDWPATMRDVRAGVFLTALSLLMIGVGVWTAMPGWALACVGILTGANGMFTFADYRDVHRRRGGLLASDMGWRKGMSWWHEVEHRLGWNRGHVASALDDRGTVWIAFRCVTCGRLSEKHATHPPPDEKFTDDRMLTP